MAAGILPTAAAAAAPPRLPKGRPAAIKRPRVLPLGAAERTLRNGLRVIVVPTKLKDVASLHIPVQVGSRNEIEPGRSGFAHFFEHMMFRGTKRYPGKKVDELTTLLGVDRNAYTNFDLTNYHESFLSEDLGKMLEVEADRFKNLSYGKRVFQTEAGAISGEYRNRYSPGGKLFDTVLDAAFTSHPYKHSVIGTPEDIEGMPNQYAFSKEFFRRYYRPDRTTLVVSGDVEPEKVFRLVKEHWKDWRPARPPIPSVPREPRAAGPVYRHVAWESPTAPLVQVAVRTPAFSDRNVGHGALQLGFEVAFGSSSELYQRLVLREQKLVSLGFSAPESKDPFVFVVSAKLRDPKDAAYVRDEILKTMKQSTVEAPSRRALEAVQSRVRYQLEAGWDSADAIAGSVAEYAHHGRSFGTMDRYYQKLQQITPEQVRRASRRYVRDDGLVVATLSHEPLGAAVAKIPSLASLALPERAPAPDAARAAAVERAPAAPRARSAPRPGGPRRGDAPTAPPRATAVRDVAVLKTDLPLVNLQLRFDVGSAHDPKGKEGLSFLASTMLTDAGSRAKTIAEVDRELYPIAGQFGGGRGPTRDATVLSGAVHREQWSRFVDTVVPLVTDPGFRAEDFERLKQQQLQALEQLRGDGTGLAMARLKANLYEGTPLAHPPLGTLESVRALTLEDVRQFVRSGYARDSLRIGLAGDVSDEMVGYLKSKLGALPARATLGGPVVAAPSARPAAGRTIEIIQKKDAQGTTFGLARRLELERSSPDYPALLVAASALGGGFGSRLFEAIRGQRGLSYGAYASVQPGPGSTFTLYSLPVSPGNAPMALRIALHELERFTARGLTAKEFELRKQQLLRSTLVETATQEAKLGSTVTGRTYGVESVVADLRERVGKLTLKDVNRVIREQLAPREFSVVAVTADAEALRSQLLSSAPPPLRYDGPKAKALLALDERIAKEALGLRAADVRVTAAEQLFAR